MAIGGVALECSKNEGDFGYEIRREGIKRLSRVRGGWRSILGPWIKDEFVRM